MKHDSAKDKPSGVDWTAVRQRMALVQSALDHGLEPTERDKKRILKERARVIAKEPSPATTGERLEVITFILADETYGIESSCVREVYALRELTLIPCTPAYVLGVTTVRGRIISVIDMKKFFELPEEGLSELDKIVIVESGDIEIGIRAEAITGAQSLPLEAIQLGLPTLTGIREKYIRGVTPERVVVLDIAKLLSDPDIIVNEEVED
jgi:purine-binding chemotaxis protein CheW